MLIRRLQNKKTNHNEIINIELYMTTARKAKSQDKIQNKLGLSCAKLRPA